MTTETTETIETEDQLIDALHRYSRKRTSAEVVFEIVLSGATDSPNVLPVLRISPDHLLDGGKGTIESATERFRTMRTLTRRLMSGESLE